MRKIKMVLMGAHINSTNLGCQALTYSLISMLEKIAKKHDYLITYYIFEYQPDYKKTRELSNRMEIEENRVISLAFPSSLSLIGKIRNFKNYYLFYKKVARCDMAIDITAGDSFSDIYGDERFLCLIIHDVTKTYI